MSLLDVVVEGAVVGRRSYLRSEGARDILTTMKRGPLVAKVQLAFAILWGGAASLACSGGSSAPPQPTDAARLADVQGPGDAEPSPADAAQGSADDAGRSAEAGALVGCTRSAGGAHCTGPYCYSVQCDGAPNGSAPTASCPQSNCDVTCVQACDVNCYQGTCNLAVGSKSNVNCSLGANCAGSTGSEASVDCSGATNCSLSVGVGSSVACSSATTCEVRCAGDCNVDCSGAKSCKVHCTNGANCAVKTASCSPSAACADGLTRVCGGATCT